jgi:hypothetical protein
MPVTSLNPLQNSSALSQLLALQPSTQTSTVQSTPASSTQSNGADSLSLSSAALQALQGLGLDPTQIQQQAQTYTAKGHHHHHHGAAPAQPGTSDQQGTASQTTQAPSI